MGSARTSAAEKTARATATNRAPARSDSRDDSEYLGLVPKSAKARRLVAVFGIAALSLSVFLSVKLLRLANRQPNVIFVVMDTLRADRTSLCGYMHPTTPKLEELVERGASYACNSHSPSTWTLPSHATFFTGLGPEDHQAGSGGNTKGMTWGSVTLLGPRWPTLAEEMAARGYRFSTSALKER